MQEFNALHLDPSTTTTRTASSAATAAAVVSQSSHALKQTFDHSHHHHPSSHPPQPASFDAETRQAIVTVLQSYRIHIAVIFRRLLGIPRHEA